MARKGFFLRLKGEGQSTLTKGGTVQAKTLFTGAPHVLSGKQFPRRWLEEELFPLSESMGEVASSRTMNALLGRRVRLLFYEPSERTLDSFVSACDLLGARNTWLGNPEIFSSQAKGESLADMIRVICRYHYDLIVMRSKQQGEVEKAASVSGRVPVINAGDGPGEHPTQALLDAFTIHRELGTIDDVSIALVGDLHYSRTIRSLAFMLPQWNVGRIAFVGPPNWRVGEDVRAFLDDNGVCYSEGTDLAAVASEVDIVYLTRAQTERTNLAMRFLDSPDQKVCVTLTDEVLERMPGHARVMHPLPRNDEFGELPEEFTDHPKVIIFDEVYNGLLIRMALLQMLLG